MAVRDSVTVSMAERIMGILRAILPVNSVEVSTSLGSISDSAGTRSKSSKVNDSAT
jgi:hypothetical protein